MQQKLTCLCVLEGKARVDCIDIQNPIIDEQRVKQLDWTDFYAGAKEANSGEMTALLGNHISTTIQWMLAIFTIV